MIYPLDNKGNVINEGALNKIQKNYLPLINEITDALNSKLFSKIHSIYVRGSVSVGRAKLNISDLDMVVILHSSLSEDEILWRSDLIQKLENKYPFITMLDLTCVSISDFLNNPKFKRLKVYLATQSVCLYGKNILNTLGKIKPNKNLARAMYQEIEEELIALSEYFSEPLAKKSYLTKNRPPRFWCVWTMRLLLRSSLGLVMCHRPIYTQDLRTCLHEFINEYPEYYREMKQALLWAHNPTSNKKLIANYLQKVIPNYIKLWEKEGIINHDN